MLYSAVYLVSALVLVAAPLFASYYFAKKWNFSKKVFWKAGLMALVVDLFYVAVMGNGGAMLPSWFTSSPLLMSLIIGAGLGLFSELGRFLVLDKVFPKLRTFREGLYFAIGWSGVATFLLGILMLITIPFMQFIINAENFEQVWPNASSQEIEQLQQAKTIAIETLNGHPLTALSPLIERGAKTALDLSLTVLVLLSLATGKPKYPWSAVGLRSMIFFVFSYASAYSHPAADFILVALAAFSLSIIRQYKKQYPKYLR